MTRGVEGGRRRGRDLPLWARWHEVKKFWFVAAMLDPRFKKLTFDGDRMLKPAMRRDALKWLTEEYNQHFKYKAYTPPTDAGPSATTDAADAMLALVLLTSPNVSVLLFSSATVVLLFMLTIRTVFTP